jgi:L-rhamnose mutarotase
VIASLRGAGLHDYTIHYNPGAQLLVQRFRVAAPDPATALRGLSESEVLQPWTELTASCQRPLPGYVSWAPMSEVFRLEWCQI